MNPAPGTSWPDLHYVDAEQVELDVSAIIARGIRLRRRRLIINVAAAAVVVGIAPVAVVVEVSGSVPAHTTKTASEPKAPITGVNAGVNEPATGAAAAGPATVHRASEPRKMMAGPLDAGAATAGGDLMVSLAQADVRHATTLPHRFGRMLAVAGALGGGGLWFAATSGQLRLFRLSTAGALTSWPLPTLASSVRANGGVGLAVTTAGVAWIGVGSTLLSLDTKSSRVSTCQLAGAAGGSIADSVAVSPDGQVAVATSHSSSVRVLDPRAGTLRQIWLPDAHDQALAVGYARNGTLGIGYQRPGKPRSGAVLLVKRTGAERRAPIPQPTAVAAYGASGLLVGIAAPYVVPSRGHPRPLMLPVDSPGTAGVMIPPALLAGNQLAVVMDTAILTFPAITSKAIAITQSTLWVTPPPRCRPHRGCPAGYQFGASDSVGNLWLVPKADPRTVELLSLR
jgi:hypothetical protein